MKHIKFRETKISLLIFILLTFCACASKSRDIKLCPNIIIHSPDKLVFTDTEKKLLCGDPESIAYKVVPLYQAQFGMQGFLQSRGFSHPRFVYEDQLLSVYTEEKSHLKEIRILSDTDVESLKVEKEIYKHYKNDEITPKLLDTIEARARSIIRDHGFPCVKVSSVVDPQTGILSITLKNMMPAKFGVVTKESIEGIDDRALERFYSFGADESFKERELTLTEKRFLRQGIVQATFFQESCKIEENTFSLNQKFVIGPPHTIRFGVGASTEVGPMIRAKWTNQRYGEMASLLEANVQASFKKQSLSLIVDKFFWNDSPRRSLDTELSFERNDQNNFKELLYSLKPHMKWTRDTENRYWQWSIGPSFIAGSFKTDINSDNRTFKSGAIEGQILSNTHTYEIYDDHPEEGEFYQFNFDFRHPSLGFSDPLLKLDLTYLKLIWLGNLSNGSSILGVRANTSTTLVPDDVLITNLPPSTKFYGGGSDDIRGFKLNSLPDASGLGALSKLSAKLELRQTNFFAEKFEGFIFVDSAYFGVKSFRVDPRLWYSPGLGLRWLSPIGIVQTYVARGLSTKSSANFSTDSGNFFYLGLGGVF